jgi:hypothetical protein
MQQHDPTSSPGGEGWQHDLNTAPPYMVIPAARSPPLRQRQCSQVHLLLEGPLLAVAAKQLELGDLGGGQLLLQRVDGG